MASSMDSVSRTITLKFNEEENNIVVSNNIIAKSVLEDYFPRGSNLKYSVEGKSFLLQRQNDNICLLPNVDSYEVTSPGVSGSPDSDDKSNPRKKKFNEMLQKINIIKESTSKKAKKKKLVDQNVPINIKKKSEVKKSVLSRVLYVNWKHKKNPHASYEPKINSIGGMKKIYLDGHVDYPLEVLETKILEQYIEDSNRSYFKECDVTLATCDDQPLLKYTDDDDDECDFWSFSKSKLRDSRKRTRVNILTVKAPSTNAPANDSNENSLPPNSNPSKPKDIIASVNVTNKENSAENIIKQNLGPSKPLITTPSQLSDKSFSILRNKDSIRETTDKCKPNKSKLLSNLNGSSSVIPSPSFSELTDKAFPSPQKDGSILNVSSSVISSQKDGSNLNKSLSVVPPPSFSELTSKAFSSPQKDCSILNICSSVISSPQKDGSNLNKSLSVVPPPSFSELTNKAFSSPQKDGSILNVSSSVISSPQKDSSKVHLSFKFPDFKYDVDQLNLSIKKIKESELKFSNITLGRGGQGIVTKGKYVGTNVAIKSMVKSGFDKLILREIKLLDGIRHPNIISIMAVSSTPTQFHIVMEFFDSLSLFSLLFDKTKKTQAVKYMSSKNKIALQLCTAVAYLHLQKPPIIHRDIKPSNILINEFGELKVCDLGLGRCSSVDTIFQSTRQGSVRGTYFYMSPDLILNHAVANTATDVWAVACTLIELYSGEPVWKVKNMNNVLLALMEIFKNRTVPIMNSIPTFLQKNLTKCFSYDAKMRPHICVLQSLLLTHQNC